MAEINLSKYGITGTTEIVHNPSYELLFEEETKAGLEGFEKGQVSELGAVNVMTGVYTGRSPKDKFIVVDENSIGGFLSGILNGFVALFNGSGVVRGLQIVLIVRGGFVKLLRSTEWRNSADATCGCARITGDCDPKMVAGDMDGMP